VNKFRLEGILEHKKMIQITQTKNIIFYYNIDPLYSIIAGIHCNIQ
jgi:hypothetical protein